MDSINAKNVRDELCRELVRFFGLKTPAYVKPGVLVLNTSGNFLGALQVTVSRNKGCYVVDPGIVIFWDRFSQALSDVLAGATFGSTTPKRGGAPCISRHYAALLFKRQKAEGIIDPGKMKQFPDLFVGEASQIPDAARRIWAIHKEVGEDFLAAWSSFESAVKFLGLDEDAPGSWRPLLEFLLLSEVNGLASACSWCLDSSRESSGLYRTQFGREQLQWIRANFCS